MRVHIGFIRFLLCVVVGIAALTASSSAYAQDEKAKAITLIKEANAATEEGKHREALLKYKAAFDLTEDPRILYRVGLSYESLGNYQRAREHLELYLFADPDSEYKDRIEKKIALLKEKEKTLQARIEIASNPAGALVFVDGERNRPFGKTPLTLPVGAGQHSVLVTMGQAQKSFEVTVKEGETVKREVELGPAALEKGGEVKEGQATETVSTTTGGGDASHTAPKTVTKVDIAPPAYMTVIGWSLIATAMSMGLIALAVQNSFIVYSVGAAAFIGGGFILWFDKDSNTDHLQRIGTDGAPSAYGAGWGWEF